MTPVRIFHRFERFSTFAALALGILLASDALAADLAAQVTIRRDEYGVPHILAETEEAAAYGYGYAQAEDRILTTTRLILKARSEEARYFGRSFARSDLQVKQFRMYEGAEAGFAKTPPWFQRILSSPTQRMEHG